jgi:hypothetical protein
MFFFGFSKSIALTTILVFSVTGQVPSPDDPGAKKLFREAQSLYEHGTDVSFRSALEKFRTAAEIFSQQGDKYNQAESLVYCGMIEEKLGNNERAIKTYESSLPISRVAGHKTRRRGRTRKYWSCFRGNRSISKRHRLFREGASPPSESWAQTIGGVRILVHRFSVPFPR